MSIGISNFNSLENFSLHQNFDSSNLEDVQVKELAKKFELEPVESPHQECSMKSDSPRHGPYSVTNIVSRLNAMSSTV